MEMSVKICDDKNKDHSEFKRIQIQINVYWFATMNGEISFLKRWKQIHLGNDGITTCITK